MDPYLVYYPRQNRNLCASSVNGIGAKPDQRWENFRNNLGYILRYSRRLDLAQLVNNTCEDHRRLLEAAGLSLTVEVAEAPLWIDGDPTRLHQMLGKLKTVPAP